ncbi:hypothetical protein [Pantoea ananatis]|nr:hypothetical protein [Pantoea ananatis]
MNVNDYTHQHNLSVDMHHEAAQAGLNEWHRIVATRDWKSFPHLLAE